MASILATYKNRMKSSRNVCEDHWDRAIDNYKHYLGKLDVGGIQESDYPFTSKMTVPLSYDLVETVIPRVIGKDPEFTPVAVEPSDVPYENTARIAIDMGYNNPKLELLGEPIYLKLVKGVKEELITGNVVWRAFWRREKMRRVRYTASLEKTGHKNAPIQTVVEAAKRINAEGEIRYGKSFTDSPFLDDFDIRHVPFFFFFPDPSFSEPGRMRYQIERCYMSPQELFSEAEDFGYDKSTMDDIQRMIDRGSHGFTPEVKKDFLVEYNGLFNDDTSALTTTDDDKVPLLIVDKMWENGQVVHVIVNEKYTVTGERGMRNPYDVQKNPFIFGSDVVIPHSYFARGELDAMKKLEDGVTDIYNMRFDNLIQSMLNFWLVNNNFLADGDEFMPIPNTITSVTDIDRAVKIIAGKDVTGNAYREASELIGLVRKITGTEDYIKGDRGQSLGGRTYGGMRLVQELVNARFIIKSRLFEKTALKSLGYFILELSRQYINKNRVKRMVGETGEIEEKLLKASDLKTIKGFMDIKILPNSAMAVDQQAEAMRMNTIADRFTLQKGPFANIPEEVYDKFLLKYLLANGITDAVYWVRMRQKARLEQKKEDKKQAKQVQSQPPMVNPPTTSTPPLENTPAGMPSPIPTMPVVQSDQIANQPAVLPQILNQSLPLQ